jgi:bifunctional DNase/RNase
MVALCLLPYNNDQIIKISETQIILSCTSNTPIYVYDHVFDMTDQFDCYFDKIFNDLIQGLHYMTYL